jgi:hypothetical protein
VIHRLRRRHFAIWVALAILLPFLLVAALRARRAPPIVPIPDALAPYATPADDVTPPAVSAR